MLSPKCPPPAVRRGERSPICPHPAAIGLRLGCPWLCWLFCIVCGVLPLCASLSLTLSLYVSISARVCLSVAAMIQFVARHAHWSFWCDFALSHVAAAAESTGYKLGTVVDTNNVTVLGLVNVQDDETLWTKTVASPGSGVREGHKTTWKLFVAYKMTRNNALRHCHSFGVNWWLISSRNHFPIFWWFDISVDTCCGSCSDVSYLGHFKITELNGTAWNKLSKQICLERQPIKSLADSLQL